MGHDITAYTRNGNEFRGPYFTRFWWPHYGYLDAHHHNDGISGDGKDEEMTPERLQTALQRVEADLSAERESLREIEDRIRGFQAKAVAELSNLAAQREILHAELQASDELRELKAQLEPITLERRKYSPRHKVPAKMSFGEWAKTPERAEWSRLGKQASVIERRIEELNAPLVEIEKRIAEIEPFASDFMRAVLERQKREAMGRRKPGVPYILAPCPDDPEGDWMPVPLQDLFAPTGSDDEDDEEKPRDEGLSAVQHRRGCLETIEVYEELRDFFNRCIEEDVVRIRFW